MLVCDCASCVPQAAGGFGRDAPSATDKVYEWGEEDEQGEQKSRKYYVKSSPCQNRKNNYNQLEMNKRSLRHADVRQREPISVDKMYSGSAKTCSTSLYGHKQRVRAIDPDHEKCRQSENHNSFAKWRKERHQYSSSNYSRKVEDVVLLDDEDMQPEEQVDFEIPDAQNESRIYYPSREDPEAVELTGLDIKCLDPGVFLSSPVINFYIQYIIKKAELAKEEKFYIFNTYFYSKLKEALFGKGDFLKLRRWWKGVNIFHRAYIILPIHGMAHWSLIIICMPAKESNSAPIILHLDSLGMHPSSEIFGTVERYLEAEWWHLKKNPPPDTTISETTWEDLSANIHTEEVQVPRQNNAFDCGIFMLYYIERFIRVAPERFTRDKLNMFSRSWFDSDEASDLRPRIQALLLEEFESARVDDGMSEAASSDASEDIIKGGEIEAVTPSDSSEMVIEDVESGDNGKKNKGSMVAEEASGESEGTGKRNVSITEVETWDEAPTSSSRRDEKTEDCLLSEEATFFDTVKDEEDAVKADSGSSKTEGEFAIVSPDRWKDHEGFIPSKPYPDSDYSKTEGLIILSPDRPKSRKGIIRSMTYPDVCDSCDSDTDSVEITQGPKSELTKLLE